MRFPKKKIFSSRKEQRNVRIENSLNSKKKKKKKFPFPILNKFASFFKNVNSQKPNKYLLKKNAINRFENYRKAR